MCCCGYTARWLSGGQLGAAATDKGHSRKPYSCLWIRYPVNSIWTTIRKVLRWSVGLEDDEVVVCRPRDPLFLVCRSSKIGGGASYETNRTLDRAGDRTISGAGSSENASRTRRVSVSSKELH